MSIDMDSKVENKKNENDSTPKTRNGRESYWLVRFLNKLDLQLVILALAIVILTIYFSLQTPIFLTTNNLLNILNQNATTFVVACAAGMLLIAGYIDMSVGSTMALAGVSGALTFVNFGFVPGLIVALLVGLMIGVLNGLLIAVIGLSPIVVTLGGLAAARGLAQVLSPGSLFGMPDEVMELGSGKFFGVSYLIWIAFFVCLVTYFISSKLPLGRHITAIGANSRAAFLTGIRVKPIVFMLYVGVGAAVGLAAVMTVARLGSAPSGTLGLGFETAILTAILLGGVPFTGGRGSLVGVVMGVLLIAILNNGLTLMNVPPEASGIITGLVLILAATSSLKGFQMRRKRPRRATLSKSK